MSDYRFYAVFGILIFLAILIFVTRYFFQNIRNKNIKNRFVSLLEIEKHNQMQMIKPRLLEILDSYASAQWDPWPSSDLVLSQEDVNHIVNLLKRNNYIDINIFTPRNIRDFIDSVAIELKYLVFKKVFSKYLFDQGGDSLFAKIGLDRPSIRKKYTKAYYQLFGSNYIFVSFLRSMLEESSVLVTDDFLQGNIAAYAATHGDKGLYNLSSGLHSNIVSNILDTTKTQKHDQSFLDKISSMSGSDFYNMLSSFYQSKGYLIKSVGEVSPKKSEIIISKDNVDTLVKIRSSRRETGVNEIKNAINSKNHHNCDNLVVVTNSKFNDRAHSFANEQNVKLLDQTKLLDLLYTTES